MRTFIIIIVIMLAQFFYKADRVFANLLNISNVALIPSTTAGAAIVEFDISWENSWRNSVNHDAVWVFVKYKTKTEDWAHASLTTSGINPSGYSRGTGTTISIDVAHLGGSTRKGCFISRTNVGYGTVDTDDIQLLWDYNTDGVSDTDVIDEIKVLGVEMVYIPEGNFIIGDGNGSGESTYAFHVASDSGVHITSDSASDVVADSGGLDDATLVVDGIGIDGDDGLDIDNNGIWALFGGTDNLYFPTGWQDSYMMKYEISQGQYSDFLNLLPDAQAANRYDNSTYGTYRYTIDTDYSVDREDRACVYLSWMDTAAFCDWAALRPMSELEFEKAARGTDASVLGEYAWGNSSINGAEAGEISESPERGSEQITDADANACYSTVSFTSGDSGSGPLRVGIFAESSTNRVTSGASYYGVMELSGNVWEMAVSLGGDSGRRYRGEGDGTLHSTGNSDETSWPGYTAESGVYTAGGVGFRGGAWNSGTTAPRTSNRSNATTSTCVLTRCGSVGGRCVRSYTDYGALE
ncbi:formylglycine-generating enzyme family protein [Candidatus Omnitrophota bacterium]